MGEALITRRGGGGEQMFTNYSSVFHYCIGELSEGIYLGNIYRGQTETFTCSLGECYAYDTSSYGLLKATDAVKEGVLFVDFPAIAIPFKVGETISLEHSTTDGNHLEMVTSVSNETGDWVVTVETTMLSTSVDNGVYMQIADIIGTIE